MSAVLRAAKIMRVNRAHPGVFARYHRGDPGFLDGLWNGIKGAAKGFLAGGPVGAVLGGTQGLVSGGKPGGGGKVGGILGGMLDGLNKNRQLVSVGTAAATLPMTTAGPGLGLLPPWPSLPGKTQPSDGGIPGPVEWMKNQGVRFPDQAAGGQCPRGYHPNKTGYYTKEGYVAPGTACVKNRKRNPLNPRAASRAMARLEGARKATRAIQKFFGGTGVKRHSHAPARGGCGCRKKR